MTDLYRKVYSVENMNTAWRAVREKAIRSASSSIRNEAHQFDERSPQNLKSIQDRLRKGTFRFQPSFGLAKKREGKSPRPIVITSVENKIVHRAILEVLHSSVPEIEMLSQIPTSFGGVKGKSVRQAIGLVRKNTKSGNIFYIRSDIPNFFTKVNKSRINLLLEACISEERFLSLVKDAIYTNLENYEDLKRRGVDTIFPLWDEGVAQGSSLSPMLANLYLRHFDDEMSQSSDFLCIRYVDDFLILGSSEKLVSKGFRQASAILKKLQLDVYSPDSNPEKASRGNVKDGLDFLGCHITLDTVTPSKAARRKLLDRIDAETRSARAELNLISKVEKSTKGGCYAKALTNINNIVWGWAKAFSFCEKSHILTSLDGDIGKRLRQFDEVVRQAIKKSSNSDLRAILGVRMLVDALDEEEQE